MILLEKHTGLAVNPDDVTSMCYSPSLNGGKWLIITTRNGQDLSVKHSPFNGGTNVYELHAQLLEAL
ncbi:hypothetical protein [Pseudomonas fluorescens]|nr:hypothetical protein [Pseudomonas fluorescens]